MTCSLPHWANAASLLLQELAAAEAMAQKGLARIEDSTKSSAYSAWLGFYNSFKKALRWTPEQLVQQANYFSQTIGQLHPHAVLSLPARGPVLMPAWVTVHQCMLHLLYRVK